MRREMRSKVVALAILAMIGIAMSFVYTVIVGGRAEEPNIFGGEPAISMTITVHTEWLTEDEEAKALKIALNDPRVREIINGKEYKVFGLGAITEITEGGERRGAGATMMILIPEEEAMYAVFVSLEREDVTCIITLSEPK